MKKIQMVDLQTQYEFIKDKVDNSVLEVMKNGTFINGPSVSEFQSNLESYLNVKHVIPCANGTDALQIALMSLELKPGDEIIKYDFTFAVTIEKDDLVFNNTVIDKSSLEIIKGSLVDYKKEMIGDSFVINNPKASSSCGCGLSFSV